MQPFRLARANRFLGVRIGPQELQFPMQKLPILAALAATAGVAAAQNPRTPVRVDTASNFAEVPCVASDQDLSAIL